MAHPNLIDSFFIIFSGAAVLATLSLYTRQPMLVAYIVLGCVIGPHGFALINDDRHLSEIAEIGIMFLLFLVGLDLQPSKLRNMVGESMLTALGTTLAFFVLGAGVMLFFDFAITESIVVGLALTFSSTILGLKLLPTTALHHRHIGQLVISLLLIQDLLAIIAIVVVSEFTPELSALMQNLGAVLLALPVLGLCAFAGVRFVLLPLIRRFDAFHEYIFLIAIAWCLGLASLSHSLNLSFEIGAFTAGVSLATSPIAQYIAEHLRPLRDFFLIMFFFSVGADLNTSLIGTLWLPILVTSVVVVVSKPLVFGVLLKVQGEPTSTAKEVGARLGQGSEFALLLSYIAVGNALLGEAAAAVLQTATVLTMVINSYWVVSRYPSPIAANPSLRRD
jgi:Kef-type K+ transport system membrane component KefB